MESPSLHAEYQHHREAVPKQRRALRTEITINNPDDFGIRKDLVNLYALRKIDFSADRRLLGVQRLDHDPIAGSDAIHAVTDPILTANGNRVPSLLIGKPRRHALLAALLTFRTQTDSPTTICVNSPVNSADSSQLKSAPGESGRDESVETLRGDRR